MVCLADRGFYGFRLWGLARATGAELVWRIKKVMVLPRETELRDGSYLSRIYESQNEQKQKKNGIVVRVVDYTLVGLKEAEPIYRSSPLARSAPPLPVRPDPGLSSRFGALWVISASPPQGGVNRLKY